jgi:hypothetical protein
VNASAPTRRLPAAARLGLVILSVLSLMGGIWLAVPVRGPLQMLPGFLGFAAYVVLFGRAVDGPALHGPDSHG